MSREFAFRFACKHYEELNDPFLVFDVLRDNRRLYSLDMFEEFLELLHVSMNTDKTTRINKGLERGTT